MNMHDDAIGPIAALALGFALAFANGANDVSKGVATLVGAGLANPRVAVAWGTAFTALGALVGPMAGSALVATFGKGLLGADVVPTLAASVSALAGASAWVLLATWRGWPVSTTHALVGALAGVGVLAYGVSGFLWSALGAKVLLPLLLSPAAAFALVWVVLRLARFGRQPGAAGADCACAEIGASCAMSGAGGAIALRETATLRVTTGTTADCARDAPGALRLTADHVHWLTSAAASAARGLNDAPKIVGLVVAASWLGAGDTPSTVLPFALVTLGIVLGSLSAGLRVTRVLAERVTPMDHLEGLAANLTTAVLVTGGALAGWPMSTTHVSSGGIAAVGLRRGSLDTGTLRRIAAAWVMTLPGAAALGALAWGTAVLFA